MDSERTTARQCSCMSRRLDRTPGRQDTRTRAGSATAVGATSSSPQNENATVHYHQGAASAAEKTPTKFRRLHLTLFLFLLVQPMAHTQPTHGRFAMSKAGFQHVAPSPEGQRLGSRKALSLGGSRERSGRGEFFTRSRMIGTTHSKARNVCSVSARYHAAYFKAIVRGVPREKARREPVGPAPPAACG